MAIRNRLRCFVAVIANRCNSCNLIEAGYKTSSAETGSKPVSSTSTVTDAVTRPCIHYILALASNESSAKLIGNNALLSFQIANLSSGGARANFYSS